MDCLNTPGIDLDGIRSRLGSVQGTFGNSDSLGRRFYVRLREVLFADVPELLDEVDRLRKIEAALLDAKKWKRTQEATLKHSSRELYRMGHLESAHEDERDARMLGESAEELERILDGKTIA